MKTTTSTMFFFFFRPFSPLRLFLGHWAMEMIKILCIYVCLGHSHSKNLGFYKVSEPSVSQTIVFIIV